MSEIARPPVGYHYEIIVDSGPNETRYKPVSYIEVLSGGVARFSTPDSTFILSGNTPWIAISRSDKK